MPILLIPAIALDFLSSFMAITFAKAAPNRRLHKVMHNVDLTEGHHNLGYAGLMTTT